MRVIGLAISRLLLLSHLALLDSFFGIAKPYGDQKEMWSSWSVFYTHFYCDVKVVVSKLGMVNNTCLFICFPNSSDALNSTEFSPQEIYELRNQIPPLA